MEPTNIAAAWDGQWPHIQTNKGGLGLHPVPPTILGRRAPVNLHSQGHEVHADHTTTVLRCRVLLVKGKNRQLSEGGGKCQHGAGGKRHHEPFRGKAKLQRVRKNRLRFACDGRGECAVCGNALESYGWITGMTLLS